MWLCANVLGVCKIWWRNNIRGNLYKKQSLCWKHVNSNIGAEHHLYFVLYGDHLMFFGDQTLQAPKTLAHNHIHQVSDFFEFFCYFFRIYCSFRGCTKGGCSHYFPISFLSFLLCRLARWNMPTKDGSPIPLCQQAYMIWYTIQNMECLSRLKITLLDNDLWFVWIW